jgi:hypothetical protein
MDTLGTLEPTAVNAPKPARHAYAQLQQQLAPPVRRSWLQRLFQTPERRFATVLASLLLVFALSLSFPTVRAAASDFLGLFRVQKFAAISISPEQIAILEQLAESGVTPGEVEMIEEPGEPVTFASLGAAARQTGLTPRTLPSLGDPMEVQVMDGANGRLLVDLDSARTILSATGSDPALLPDSLDGQPINIQTFPAVAQHWGNDVMLLQSESPNISYPDGLDATLIGQAVLRALGLNEAEAARLAQQIDWTGTLLLPIPQNVASFSEVTVDGTSGIGLTSLDNEGNMVMWQKDGVIYVLAGQQDVAGLLDMAAELR